MRAPAHPRPTGAAEKALKERERLWRHYRSQRQKRRQELYQGHPRLEAFGRQIRRFGPDDAAGFLTYVEEENRAWLITAPPEIRAEALSMVSERIQRVRAREGLAPFDDPLPDEENDLYQMCKQELR